MSNGQRRSACHWRAACAARLVLTIPSRSQRIMQLEDDQARWSAMEWKVQPVANMTFWVYVFTGVIALCLLIYFEEEHGVTPFGTTLFEWLFAMKGRNVKLEIPKSDGGVLQLEHTSQFHYAIQNYGYILVQFCVSLLPAGVCIGLLWGSI